MTDAEIDAPEFRIVVRRPGRGPIAPYRLLIVMLFVFAIVGRDLYAAAMTGANVDDALIRGAIAGIFAWFVLGRMNAILKQATPPKASAEEDGDATAVAPGDET